MILRLLPFLFVLLCCSMAHAASRDVARPNILWIFVEDMSPWLGCYGDTLASSPNIDELASKGVRFERAFVPAPVCSACRSAMIIGAMQTTTGTHQHRSSRTKESAIHLPEGIETLPTVFQKNGYYTFNRGKEDYNFVHNLKTLYNGQGNQTWENSPEGTPFFGQIQLKGGKSNTKKVADKMDPAKVTVPAYMPDHEIYKKCWAQHYDAVQVCDMDVKGIMERLAADKLLESTWVIFFTDHGFNHSLRHKQMCYEGGVHVPLIIVPPKGTQSDLVGQVRSDLVSCLDISATSYALAGIDIPGYVEGQNLFADKFVARDHVISARDRCDYTIDRVRTVRTDRFRYLRNYLTDRPLLQPQYRDNQDYVTYLRKGHAAVTLDPKVDAIWFGPRPAEELYDLDADPDELNNLADDPAHAATLAHHRALLEEWIVATDDQGQYPESDAGLQAVLTQWKAKCVNPEYDHLRTGTSKVPVDTADDSTLKILLVAGGCCHDYAVQSRLLKAGIESRINAKVSVAFNPDSGTAPTFDVYEKDDWAADYDLVLHDECAAKLTNKTYVARILNAHKNGVPAVNLHCAMHSYRWGDFATQPVKDGADNAGWFEMLGIQSSRHGPKAPIAVELAGAPHPTVMGLTDWVTGDEELYNNLRVFDTVTPLLTGRQLQMPRRKKGTKKDPDAKPVEASAVVAWLNTYGENKTPIFNTTLGHYNRTVADDRYLDFVTRGILWATGHLEDDGTPSPGYDVKK